ncbi:threonine-phosphate decarboxylase CobD [Acidiphilium sp.]|uniref:threonine-phosphate decarboxylase CobD n=1 Tax=Acidiphilium sp. TaxID=527 RepID=UPI003D08A51E
MARATMMREPATAPILHGGRLEAMRRRYPAAPEPWIDLSTGINPIAYPLPSWSDDCFTRLPEPEAVTRLERLAASAYGVGDPVMVAAAPGTQILIDLLPRLLAQPHVAILGPTYAEHAAAWARAASTVTMIATIDDIATPGSVVLCNPNNPDGRIIAPAALRPLADRLASRGGYLIIDEAFADLAPPGTSLAGDLPHPALIILRSFGKTYGLAGVRLGFALAAPPITAMIRAALGPWAISGPALTAGAAALADRDWLTATRNRLRDDTATLDRLLSEAGMTGQGGTALFRLVSTPRAALWCDHLARAGVMVRRFEADPTWLRFGIPGPPAAWARLRHALAGIPPCA